MPGLLCRHTCEDRIRMTADGLRSDVEAVQDHLAMLRMNELSRRSSKSLANDRGGLGP